jgi:excisionase family DNA binding protein
MMLLFLPVPAIPCSLETGEPSAGYVSNVDSCHSPATFLDGRLWSRRMETQITLIQRLGNMDGLLDSKQVIRMLGVHLCTLQLWTRKGEIPFLRVGRLVRFDPGQLAKWLEERQIVG